MNYPLFGYQQVTKCIEIALKCLLDSPKKRPKISDIVSMLNTMESPNEHITNLGNSPAGPVCSYALKFLLLHDIVSLESTNGSAKSFHADKRLPMGAT